MPLQSVWIVCELYYPELTSTGRYVTVLSESLAAHFDTHVICAQPNYEALGATGPSRETRNGVSVLRCANARLDKHRLFPRSLNTLQTTIAMSMRALLEIKRGNVVIVVTNPPSLPFAIAMCCKLRRARCVLYIQDLYPEALVRSGVVRARGVMVRIMEWATRRLYRAVDKIVVDGRDVLDRVRNKTANKAKVRLIPYWAELDTVHPMPREDHPVLQELGISDKFVVQYSGNMGRLYDIDTLLRAAAIVQANSRIHFLLRGSGVKRNWAEEFVASEQLKNVTFQNYQAESKLGVMLSACDVAVIPLIPNAAGVATPSRMYNVLAAGKPIVAAADHDTELAMMVRQERVGWVVRPGHPEALAEALSEAAKSPAAVRTMGLRARAAAEQNYRAEFALAAFRDCLTSLFSQTKACR